MNIRESTKSYEEWMRRCTTVIEADLRSKHEQMKEDPFLFFRGTFYRWIELWPEICSDLCEAPQVLASGDVHVSSFGTWRDTESRLCWGIDDFDESYLFPYTNDLVRLAASLKMVIDSEDLTVGLKRGCEAILEGYQQCFKMDGCPIVLEEHEQQLEKLGMDVMTPPRNFWKKLQAFPVVTNRVPREVKNVLARALPDPSLDFKIVRRTAGLGSLGQQHFVAIASWKGALIAREAKAMVPSAMVWLTGKAGRRQDYYEKTISSAIRSHDPCQKIAEAWLIRRLSPDANPIEIAELPADRDEEALLHAMGREIANVHLGTRRQANRISKDLDRRKSNWLPSAAKRMAKAMEHEWKKFKRTF